MNSSIEITEAVKLAKKLIDRTREGRLAWEASGILLKPFTTTLEGNLKAAVSLTKSGQNELLEFSLVEFDPRRYGRIAMPSDEPTNPDNDLLRVSIEKDPSFGYDTADEMRLNGLLVDLYALARRSALKIDGSVEKALNYLDKLAV
jgi:hypothetical protein